MNGENNNSLFTLDTNGTLKIATTFDYESNASTYTIIVQAKDDLNETIEGNFTVTLLDVYEDTDGDGFRDSLEASTGSNINEPTSTPFNHGLVAWYPFDGNASDMSGNGNHGTVNGATLGYDRHGEVGKAYSFDGVDDYIDMGDETEFDGRNTQTISFWVSVGTKGFGSGNDKRPILSKWYSSGSTTLPSRNAYFIYAHEASIAFVSSSDSGYTSSGSSDYYLNKWYHAAFVFDQGNVGVHFNGTLENSENFEFSSISDSSESLLVGNWFQTYNSSYKTFHGSIDDIRIYDRALSKEEIELLYRAESPNHFVDSAKDLEMIWVEPGTFTMGQTGAGNAQIEHQVTLTKGFYLGKYEVTQAQYEAVMSGNSDGLSATPSQYSGNSNRPVEKVSYDDIHKFLTRLNEQEADNLPLGWSYVLPTEAQWEYACRAGTTTNHSWGDSITTNDANYNNDIGQTTSVGQYAANPWGFFDMHGNVWEWTKDAFVSYTSDSRIDPFNKGVAGSSRVLRGGSISKTAAFLWSAFRLYYSPSTRLHDLGFRLSFQYTNKPPTDLNSTSQLTIAENQPVGTVIGEFNATDSEGGAISYHFINGENNNSLFTLDTNGTLKTRHHI